MERQSITAEIAAAAEAAAAAAGSAAIFGQILFGDGCGRARRTILLLGFGGGALARGGGAGGVARVWEASPGAEMDSSDGLRGFKAEGSGGVGEEP